jgi:hypothetical protein
VNTNTFQPLEEGDTVTAEAMDYTHGPKTITGKVVRIWPDGRAEWLETDSGYYPLRSCVVIEHRKPWEVG